MKWWKRSRREAAWVLGAGLLLGGPAQAIPPDTTDARAIMDAVEKRDTGDKVKARLVMTITDKAGRQRQRVLQSRALEFKEGRKQIMVFESPGDVKGTALLTIDYDEGKRDDDQWLYLPSLHKSTRISSGEKSGSFMGSDFSYADMTKADPNDYDYVLKQQSVNVDGEDCWLIESTPKSEKAKKETGYLKSETWISKSKLLPLRAKAWVKEGKKLKYITFGDIKQVDGIWIAHTLTARTRRGDKDESATVLQFSEMTFNNGDVSEALFTERQLEKGL